MKHLYAKKRYKEINNKFYVFDVETNGLLAKPSAFVFGCIYGFNYRRVFYSHAEFEAILLDKRFSKTIIFAHNAAFDLQVMYGNIITNLDNNAIFNGKFICARRHKFTFADSLNIFQFSVKEIGQSLGIEKMELDNKFKEGEVNTVTEKDIEYCFRDCEIIWKALHKIFTICGSVRMTLAGLSLDYFKNTFIKSQISFNEKYVYEFFDSYYGGRVEAFKIGKTKAWKYDVNSMYPWAMKNAKFPDPRFLKKEHDVTVERLLHYLKRYEGLASCQVIHRKQKIGTLPYRHETKNGNKLTFPVGRFSGVWNFNELRYAIKTGSVSIVKVNYCIIGKAKKSPFSQFVSVVYKLRQTSEGIDKTIYKLILNSLYGKFAQRIKFTTEYHKEVPYEKIKRLQRQGIDYELQMFSQDREDCYLNIRKSKDEYLRHTIPLFSSYITSASRIRLLQYMQANEKGLVYVDTDSVCTTVKRNYNSSKLGELKEEPEIMVEIYGNKSYKQKKGETEQTKIKGIPKSAIKLKSGTYQFKKMVKSKEALRRQIDAGDFVIVEKELSMQYDKRIVDKKGQTKPLEINE